MREIKLGDLAADIVTGFEGVVISRTEWLNKCVRIQLQPRGLKDGKPVEAQSFDIEQLTLVERDAVVIDKAPTGGDPSFVAARPLGATRY